MAFNYTKKYFYEKNDWIYSPEINLKYEEVFTQFEEWVAFFRKTAVSIWQATDTPP